jgi:DNA-binding CsgD family transcriptional regulator
VAESHGLLQEAGDKRGVGLALGALSALAGATGDRAAGQALIGESLALGREMGDNACIAHALGLSGVLAARQGEHARGVRLIGAATAIHPPVRASLESDERVDLDDAIAQAESSLGGPAFADAWERGQMLTVDEAIALTQQKDEDIAATGAGAVTGARPTAPWPAGLTERQVEVLRLVARGKSNREIAADLVLGEYTVMRHLSNIFHKIGASSRAAAASFAAREGIS